MRTDVAGVIIALVLAFAGMLSVCAQDAKVSEVRKVDAFSSIEIPLWGQFILHRVTLILSGLKAGRST